MWQFMREQDRYRQQTLLAMFDEKKLGEGAFVLHIDISVR